MKTLNKIKIEFIDEDELWIDEEDISWHELLCIKALENNDSSDFYYSTLTEDEMRIKFDNGYGGENGKPFTAWTEDNVYFPMCYDGSEWVGSAPRNMCNISLDHQGG